jgi:dynein heavy chain, axonemal
MGADNMMAVMERAMAAGTSVLIENMGESIDAVLNPVIMRWGRAWGAASDQSGPL